MFVTVIIPVYNAAQQLGECLRAVRKSSYKAYEVIVIDDASTDGSFYVARTSGIIAYRLSRRSGPAAGRNLGARYARGDILFL
jgi:glycosyltransferase involved in cell wall biosynthesis